MVLRQLVRALVEDVGGDGHNQNTRQVAHRAVSESMPTEPPLVAPIDGLLAHYSVLRAPVSALIAPLKRLWACTSVELRPISKKPTIQGPSLALQPSSRHGVRIRFGSRPSRVQAEANTDESQGLAAAHWFIGGGSPMRAALNRRGGVANTVNARGAAERTNTEILVDGDNAQPSLIEAVLAEAVKYGTTTVRRIYGDWTTPNMSGWKSALQMHAFQPKQQFRYTTGKSATDSALIIDAMDLLHSGRIDGFCIVSSDCDSTRLATRIREDGLFVMGIGEPKTPKAFVNVCEVFVQTTNLASDSKTGTVTEGNDDWTKVVKQAVVAAAREDGWAFLGVVGSLVRKLDPAFDPRSHGHRQLSALVKSEPTLFKTRVSKNEHNAAVIDIKLLD